VLAGDDEGGDGQMSSLFGFGIDLVSRACCHLEKTLIKPKNANHIADKKTQGSHHFMRAIVTVLQ
jgi:hypothetical protein